MLDAARRDGAAVEGFDLKAEPRNVLGITEVEGVSAEVLDRHIHDERFVGEVKRALEAHVDLQLRAGGGQEGSKGEQEGGGCFENPGHG